MAAAVPHRALASGPRDEAAALRRLFATSDDAVTRLNPILGLMRGDRRRLGMLGDTISDNFLSGSKAAIDADLTGLKSIDRARLSATDKIYRDAFLYERTLALQPLQPPLLVVGQALSLTHYDGLIAYLPSISSGESLAPYQTIEDYEAGLARLAAFPIFVERQIVRLREGLGMGITQPRIIVGNTISLLDGIITAPLANNPYFGPAMRLPRSFDAAQRSRMEQAYRSAVDKTMIPAYQRLKTFLTVEYLPKAREAIGLSAVPGGAAYYRYLVEAMTTTTLTPEDIHAAGLRLVTELLAAMQGVRKSVGFSGTLSEFFEHLRTANTFKYRSRAEYLNSFEAVRATVDRNIGKLFRTVPRTKFEIRLVPAHAEASQAAGYYEPGSADGERAGMFYINAYDLPSRPSFARESLYLHEAIPGHHFQVSLSQEDASLPNFIRFSQNNAYVEGWALYCETLGEALGLYTDPYQKFGYLNDQMLRAMRLVVDTGIHHYGWDRAKSVSYMITNSGLGHTEIMSEVDRYIAIPGQALGYLVGKLKILELRNRAEKRLKSKFDYRAFHEQILGTGALPLTILEQKLENWSR